MMAGTVTLTVIPICHEFGSKHFSLVYCN